jgi:hypothetical protein
VAGNDDVNAALVVATGQADRVVLNGPDGWSLGG